MMFSPNNEDPPCFVLLAASAALAFAVLTASVPLLPLVFTFEHAVRTSAICIIAFLLPSIPLHPFISRVPRKRLISTLPASCLLSAIAFLIIAISLSYAGSHTLRRISFFLAFFILGAAYAVLQATIFRLVDTSIIASSHPFPRHSYGLYLAFLETCINIATIIAPPLFAFLVQITSSYSFPYYLASIAQLAIAVGVYCKLNTYAYIIPIFERHQYPQTGLLENSRLLISEPRHPPIDPNEYISSESKKKPSPLYMLLRHPWSWLIMLAMLASVATLAFLRPLLTAYVMKARGETLMHAATLFSILGITTFVTEVVVTVWIADRLGSRTTLVIGLFITSAAFPFLSNPHLPLTAVLAVVGIGSSATFVVSLMEMARTVKVSINRPVGTTSLAVSIFCTMAELLGTIFAPILSDVHDRSFFSACASRWSKFLLVSCCAVGIPFLIGALAECMFPLLPSSRVSTPESPLPTHHGDLADVRPGLR